jgi:hypothetical protein
VSWPEALRAMRSWLEPWVIKALLELVFSGQGLYLYLRYNELPLG